MLYPDALTLDSLTLTSIRLSDLLDRICVRPPYFALDQLGYRNQVFTATATGHSGHYPEYGPMQGAEISRHAAIAGLCAAALTQPDDQRRYYLAQEARYTGTLNRAPAGAPVRLTAELLSLDKRQARAAITAESEGEPLAQVEVLYTVLTDSAFSRLFRSRHQPQFLSADIDVLASLPRGIIQREGNRLIRDIEQIPAEACAGHFEGYPAMPVAILMGQLAQLAGEAFGGRFHIREASVQASDFCWAGEAARFEVTPERVTALHTTYACTAYANNRTIGQMQLVLEHKV